MCTLCQNNFENNGLLIELWNNLEVDGDKMDEIVKRCILSSESDISMMKNETMQIKRCFIVYQFMFATKSCNDE